MVRVENAFFIAQQRHRMCFSLQSNISDKNAGSEHLQAIFSGEMR